MTYPQIRGIGCAIAMSPNVGYFNVRIWVRSNNGTPTHQFDYDNLTWGEALDVIGAEFDVRRPGWELLMGEGWQPALFDNEL